MTGSTIENREDKKKKLKHLRPVFWSRREIEGRI